MIFRKFTLLELLCVIAVIAILSSLLLPALKAAKTESRKIQCSGNMKQIGLAVSMYTVDHNDYFPGAVSGARAFFKNLEDYTGIPPLTYDTTKPMGSARIYWCPGDQYRATLVSSYPNAYLCMFSYGNNYYTTWDLGTPAMQKTSKIKKPGGMLYLCETQRPEGYAELFNANSYPFLSTADPTRGVEFRHSQKTNALWIDMHLSSFKAVDMLGTGITYTYQN